jgi:hypothetical protein
MDDQLDVRLQPVADAIIALLARERLSRTEIKDVLAVVWWIASEAVAES